MNWRFPPPPGALAWRLALVLALAGCTGGRLEEPDHVYAAAQRELRLGKRDSALAEAEKGLAHFGSQPGTYWHWRFFLLKSDILAGGGKAAEVLRLLDGKLPSGPSSAELTARLRMTQGWARYLQGGYTESRIALEEAHRLAEMAGSPLLLASVQNRIGVVLEGQADPAGAAASFRGALENARGAGDRYLEAIVLGNLGWGLLERFRYDEAIPLLENAQSIAKAEGYLGESAANLQRLGVCYNGLGDYDRALAVLSRAESIFTQLADRYRLSGCVGDMGNTHYFQGNLPAAISCYRRALDLAKQENDAAMIPVWLDNLSLISIEAGDVKAAEDLNQQALDIMRKSPDRFNRFWPVLNSARIAEAKNQPAEADRLFREVIREAASADAANPLVEANARLGSLYVRTGQWRMAQTQLKSLSAAIDKSRARLSSDDWKLTFQSSVIPFYEDYVDLLMNQGRAEMALEVAESCRARVLAEKLGGTQTTAPRESADSFQANARAEGAVVFAYWLAPKQSFLWVVTAAKVTPFKLPPAKEIERLVEAYTNVILNLEDARSTSNPAGRRLFEVLVAPARHLIPSGANVVVVPDGALHHLNLEALLSSGPQPKYWMEEARIAVAPSLALLRPDGARSGRPPSALLLIGNPRSPGREYPPLPDAGTEVRNIQRRFAGTASVVLTGEDANPGAYIAARPNRFSLIHFSAHAVANYESPLDSAVILSPKGDSFKLYARVVTEAPLQAELVTISACKSAAARSYSGEGLVGFSWAFLRAGARNVIAGLWDVNDRSTAVLMSRLYEEIAKGRSPAEALRNAKLAMLADPVYRKPYYWAPFELFTRGAAFRPVRVSGSASR
jgi:CHAT domain-containing protein/Tfp pilus assembly protein PilF